MTVRLAIPGRRSALAAGTATALVLLAGQAHAAAFYLQEQSVKAVGRAFSGEVSEQGAQQMWWNPAAIGGIASAQGYFGLNAILPRANASNDGTLIARPGYAALGVPGSVTPVGGSQRAHDPINNGFLPNGGVAIPLNAHVAIGVTATSPYSFTTNYAGDSWARYSADKTRLRTYDIQPVIALSSGGLGIGAGPNIEYSKATFTNALPDPLSSLRPDGAQALSGDGWNVGFSAGVQLHTSAIDVGVSYKSAIKHKLDGSLVISRIAAPIGAAINTRAPRARASFETPWMVNAGARYRVTPRVTVEGQVTRTGWSRFDAIRLTDLGALGDQALPEAYHDTWSYALGVDYRVSPRWTLRGGVQRDLSLIPTGERDPRVPDGNRWNFALGTSYTLNPHLTIDAAASYDKIKGNAIDKTTAAYVGTPLQTVILTSGDLRNARALVFGLGGSVIF